jgi:hypothetical protein
MVRLYAPCGLSVFHVEHIRVFAPQDSLLVACLVGTSSHHLFIHTCVNRKSLTVFLTCPYQATGAVGSVMKLRPQNGPVDVMSVACRGRVSISIHAEVAAAVTWRNRTGRQHLESGASRPELHFEAGQLARGGRYCYVLVEVILSRACLGCRGVH